MKPRHGSSGRGERDRDRPRRRQRPRRDERREGGPGDEKERIERDFQREIGMRIGYFLDSDEEELELEPMNSYRRRMVHNIAKDYNLATESRGEDRERYVTLIKTEATESAPVRAPRLWDFGTQTFRINPGSEGLHMALKLDGSVELFEAADKKHIITDRVVKSSEFRIRRGRIVEPGEPGY